MEKPQLRVGTNRELLKSLFKQGGTVDIIVKKINTAKVQIKYQDQDFIIVDFGSGPTLIKETTQNGKPWYIRSPFELPQERLIIDAVNNYKHNRNNSKGLEL